MSLSLWWVQFILLKLMEGWSSLYPLPCTVLCQLVLILCSLFVPSLDLRIDLEV